MTLCLPRFYKIRNGWQISVTIPLYFAEVLFPEKLKINRNYDKDISRLLCIQPQIVIGSKNLSEFKTFYSAEEGKNRET